MSGMQRQARPTRAAEPGRQTQGGRTTRKGERHKVEPLFSALEGYDAWFTGLRREQSPTRAHLSHLEPFQLPSGKLLRKVNPLATWTSAEVSAYATAHAIPRQPLYALGYTSIGCEPCTKQPVDSSNVRSGRWDGQKLECGIHIQPVMAR